MNGPVRHKCLSVIGKLMYFSSADMIQTLINATNISRYFIVMNFWLERLGMYSALSLQTV